MHLLTENNKGVKKNIKLLLTISFFITCTVNILFFATSYYIYVSFNYWLLYKTYNTFVIIFASICIILCYIFGYVLIVTRNKIIKEITRFIDSFVYNKVIPSGVVINLYSNSAKPSRIILNEIDKIKTFISQNGILALEDVPWLFFLMLVEYKLSFTCLILLLCLTIFIFFSYVLFSYNLGEKNKILNYQKNIDYCSHILDNYEFFCNFNINNVSQNYAIYDEKLYEEKNIQEQKMKIKSTINNFITNLVQIIILIISIFLFIQNDLDISSLIVSIIICFYISKKLTNSIEAIFDIIAIKKSIQVIKSNIQQSSRYFSIMRTSHLTKKLFYKNEIILKNINYKNIKNYSNHFSGGKIYNLHSSSNDIKDNLLKIIAGIIKPTGGLVEININNSSYNNIFYCPMEPIYVYGRIIDIITGFNQEINFIKLNNIIDVLNINDDFEWLKINMNCSIDKTINENNIYFIKKLNIASALYSNSNILVLNNPFVYLDNKTTSKLKAYLYNFSKLGKIVIL